MKNIKMSKIFLKYLDVNYFSQILQPDCLKAIPVMPFNVAQVCLEFLEFICLVWTWYILTRASVHNKSTIDLKEIRD